MAMSVRGVSGRAFCGLLAAALFVAALVSGCAEPSRGPAGPDEGGEEEIVIPPPPPPPVDGLFLDEGYAWVMDLEDGPFGVSRGGLIFHEDGSGFEVYFDMGRWHFSELVWFLESDRMRFEGGGFGIAESGRFYRFVLDAGRFDLIDEHGAVRVFAPVRIEVEEVVVREWDQDLVNADDVWFGAESGDTWVFVYGEESGEPGGIVMHTVLVDGEPMVRLYGWHTFNGKITLTSLGSGAVDVFDYAIDGDEMVLNDVVYTRTVDEVIDEEEGVQ